MDVIISLLQQMSVYLVVAYLFSKTPILKSLFAVSMRLPPKAVIYVVFSGFCILGTYFGLELLDAIANTRAIGAVLGGVIALGRMLAAFGVNFFSAVPVVDIMLGMVIAIVLGTLLAAVAAVLPSFKAARLAPMEAMRVE